MVNSGHKPHFIKRILVTGISKYEKKLQLSNLDTNDKNFKPLHQPSGRCKLRLKRKALARENWIKESSDKEKSPPQIFQKDGKKRKEKVKTKQKPSTDVHSQHQEGYTIKDDERE